MALESAKRASASRPRAAYISERSDHSNAVRGVCGNWREWSACNPGLPWMEYPTKVTTSRKVQAMMAPSRLILGESVQRYKYATRIPDMQAIGSAAVKKNETMIPYVRNLARDRAFLDAHSKAPAGKRKGTSHKTHVSFRKGGNRSMWAP